MKKPFFTISLDFELLWGMFDVTTIKSYGQNIIGGRQAIPLLLSLFKKYNIHVTWGTVGMVTFENKKELIEYIPSILPKYIKTHKNPYHHLKSIGQNEREDPYHFGYSLVNQILDVEGMEIGSHSFSHFYCLDNMQKGAFEADLMSLEAAFNRLRLNAKSMIFCRNQFDEDSLNIISKMHYNSFRGNENSFIYKSRKSNHPLYLRALRLIDSYFNLSGSHLSEPFENSLGLINIPSSNFLRPVSNVLDFSDKRLRKIKNTMLIAAKQKSGYHLWFHPHNFGVNLAKNLQFLESILEYYLFLNQKYEMVSLNMDEIAKISRK